VHLDSTGTLHGIPHLELMPSEVRQFIVNVIADDGVNQYSQTFTFEVLDSSSFTVDNAVFTLGTETVSLINLGSTGSVSLSVLQPVEFVGPRVLGNILANDTHYVKIKTYDANPGLGPVVYESSGTLPPGLSIDPGIGYLYGHASPQADYLHNYQFIVKATKTDVYSGETSVNTASFSINVINQYYTNVLWPDQNLGSIEQGLISTLNVTAEQVDSTWPLNYHLMPDSVLPNGISLSTSTGNLIGSAENSGNFSFTIAASTNTYWASELAWPVYSWPVSFKTFSLTVTPNPVQYATIWAEPFLLPTQATAWNNFINDETTFVPDVLYRPDDPNFGLQTDLRVFLEYGIQSTTMSNYASALTLNFYERLIEFGAVKSAIAKDINGVHIYDVIYVEIIDPLEGAKNTITINGTPYYPASLDNIRNALESITVGEQDILIRGDSLPDFMDTAGANQPYGYYKAAVLCYTQPGQSSKILNRIINSNFNFANLAFYVDRLVVENSIDSPGPSYLVFNKRAV
jgi:hypothetical protein